MAKAKVTREMVHKAAAKLHKNGEKPTLTKVQDLVKFGSNTTVNRYFREWKILHAQDLETDPRILGKQLVQQKTISQELSTQILSLTNEKLELQSTIANLEQKIGKLEQELAIANRSKVAVVDTLEAQIQTMQDTFATTLATMAEQIERINSSAVDKVMSVGNHFDEKIIQERLELRSLREQLVFKDKQLKAEKCAN